MTTIKATALHDGDWWIAEFTLNGKEYGTQASSKEELPAAIADAAALMTNQPAASFTVALTSGDALAQA